MSSARDYVADTGATSAKDFAVRGLSERPVLLFFSRFGRIRRCPHPSSVSDKGIQNEPYPRPNSTNEESHCKISMEGEPPRSVRTR